MILKIYLFASPSLLSLSTLSSTLLLLYDVLTVSDGSASRVKFVPVRDLIVNFILDSLLSLQGQKVDIDDHSTRSLRSLSVQSVSDSENENLD